LLEAGRGLAPDPSWKGGGENRLEGGKCTIRKKGSGERFERRKPISCCEKPPERDPNREISKKREKKIKGLERKSNPPKRYHHGPGGPHHEKKGARGKRLKETGPGGENPRRSQSCLNRPVKKVGKHDRRSGNHGLQTPIPRKRGEKFEEGERMRQLTTPFDWTGKWGKRQRSSTNKNTTDLATLYGSGVRGGKGGSKRLSSNRPDHKPRSPKIGGKEAASRRPMKRRKEATKKTSIRRKTTKNQKRKFSPPSGMALPAQSPKVHKKPIKKKKSFPRKAPRMLRWEKKSSREHLHQKQ